MADSVGVSLGSSRLNAEYVVEMGVGISTVFSWSSWISCVVKDKTRFKMACWTMHATNGPTYFENCTPLVRC